MRIAIDYTPAVWQGAGIGRYTRELIGAALRLDREHEYRLFYAAGDLPADSPYLAELQLLCRELPAVQAVPLPFSPRRMAQFWQRLRAPLPLEVFTGRVDLVHSPDFTLPPTFARTLLTVHDLAFLVYPEFFVPSLARYLSQAVPRAVRRADLLLADSLATQQDMERLLGVLPSKVTVIYPGVSSAFRPIPPESLNEVRERYALPERFLLFVSTISPRKNLVRLIEAYAAAQLEDIQLVIVGQRGWLYEEVDAAIERLGMAQQIRMLDFVDDKDLPSLYNLAWASVYPSIYEGFGIPALEALACGTPLLTATNSSLPEVVGDAALLVDAEDTAAICAALRQLCYDEALRTRLQNAGPERSRRFRWERAARQLLACYAQVGADLPARQRKG